jgi:hypothetical protein
MNVREIFTSLTNTPWWSEQPRFMRMAAARYYAGVDSIEDLRNFTTPSIVYTDNYGNERWLSAPLTTEQVDEIIRLR